MASLRGQLLLAGPGLIDPNFFRSVVLVLEHNDEGALGVILNRPTDLALGPDQSLYFSDVYNHCIRKVTPEGDVYTVAGQCGEKGFEGDGGPARSALLKLPYGIELHDSLLFVADTGNNRIRSVNLDEP